VCLYLADDGMQQLQLISFGDIFASCVQNTYGQTALDATSTKEVLPTIRHNSSMPDTINLSP